MLLVSLEDSSNNRHHVRERIITLWVVLAAFILTAYLVAANIFGPYFARALWIALITRFAELSHAFEQGEIVVGINGAFSFGMLMITNVGVALVLAILLKRIFRAVVGLWKSQPLA